MTTSATESNAVASARQHLTEVAGLPGYMATRTGGERTAETSKTYDGGELVPVVLSSPAETGNIVTGKPYRPLVHGPILKEWDSLVGRFRTTIKVWDADPDLGPIGEPRVYADALLVRLAWPDGDANSSDPANFELEWAVGAMA